MERWHHDQMYVLRVEVLMHRAGARTPKCVAVGPHDAFRPRGSSGCVLHGTEPPGIRFELGRIGWVSIQVCELAFGAWAQVCRRITAIGKMLGHCEPLYAP